MKRVTFLTEFVIALAVVVGVAFAWQLGLVQAIWRADESYMTSAIAALFVVTVAVMMSASWGSIERRWRGGDFGHWAERVLPMLGLLGTVIGISMQAESLASNGMASLGALKTGFYATACGIGASAIISFMTYVLEHGE